MLRSKLILLLFVLIQSLIFSQSTLEKVKSLNLNKSEDNILTFYSDDYKHSAESIKELLGNSTNYFEKTFEINESFSIAVLDSNDWIKITQIPYGLPFVSGPPNIVCIPASTNNVLAKVIKEAIAGYNLQARYAKPVDETINLFISLIGFHELGHIYARACGIEFPNKWTFELAATYFAYLYLKENAPDAALLWVDIAKILVEEIKPQHTSLTDFEDLYVRVGVANYAWYQVVFLLQVAEVEEKQNVNFIERLITKDSLNSGDLSLSALEEIQPGFINWAKKYKLID